MPQDESATQAAVLEFISDLGGEAAWMDVVAHFQTDEGKASAEEALNRLLASGAIWEPTPGRVRMV